MLLNTGVTGIKALCNIQSDRLFYARNSVLESPSSIGGGRSVGTFIGRLLVLPLDGKSQRAFAAFQMGS